MEVTNQSLQQSPARSPISQGLWGRMRSRTMFVIAFLCSPCCAALLMPIVLSLLAGTPAALWIGDHTSWVYGGLTLISIASLVLAIRWLRRPKAIQAG
jgi:hypothetical protein